MHDVNSVTSSQQRKLPPQADERITRSHSNTGDIRAIKPIQLFKVTRFVQKKHKANVRASRNQGPVQANQMASGALELAIKCMKVNANSEHPALSLVHPERSLPAHWQKPSPPLKDRGHSQL